MALALGRAGRGGGALAVTLSVVLKIRGAAKALIVREEGEMGGLKLAATEEI